MDYQAQAERIKEKRAKLAEQRAQLKAKDKSLKSVERRVERKARTNRLVEVGVAVEKSLGYEFDTKEKRKKLLNYLIKVKTESDPNGYAALITECENPTEANPTPIEDAAAEPIGGISDAE